MSDLGASDQQPGAAGGGGDDPEVVTEVVTEVEAPAEPTSEHLPGMAPEPERIDLDSIERDLDAVDRALDRLADGTYGTDEITGQQIADDVLENDPTAGTA